MDRIELYLYATPRVGNTEWAQYVDSLSLSSKGYRIVKYGDPVPHLPVCIKANSLFTRDSPCL